MDDCSLFQSHIPTFVYFLYIHQGLFPQVSNPYRPLTYLLNSHSFIILTFPCVPYLSIIILSLCHSLYHPHASLIYHQHVTSFFSVSRRSRHQGASHSSLAVASCFLVPPTQPRPQEAQPPPTYVYISFRRASTGFISVLMYCSSGSFA